jgi:hypothetical protein
MPFGAAAAVDNPAPQIDVSRASSHESLDSTPEPISGRRASSAFFGVLVAGLFLLVADPGLALVAKTCA